MDSFGITDSQKIGSDEMLYDVEKSFFINANAGSGKTYNLVVRVLSLLLNGTRANKILCITYTNVAAIEMQERVYEVLQRWNAGKFRFRGEFGDGGDEKYGLNANNLHLASKLLDEMIESESSPRICTIDAFCLSVLKMFSLEAEFPSNTAILFDDDERKREIATKSILNFKDNEIVSKYYQELLISRTVSDLDKFESFLFDSLKSDKMKFGNFFSSFCPDWQSSVGDFIEAVERVYCDFLGEFSLSDFKKGLRFLRDKILKEFIADTSDDVVSDILEQLKDTKEGERTSLGVIAKWKNGELSKKDEESVFGTYANSIFLTTTGTLRTTKSLKGFFNTYPEGLVDSEQCRVLRCKLLLQLVSDVRSSLASCVVISELVKNYDALKRQASGVDKDDMLDKLLKLLNPESEFRDFILFKLNGGFDHILVDEAQDTNKLQWKIVWHLIEDMTSGFTAKDYKKRGIFVVGDNKQSIYSFQGALPGIFDSIFGELSGLFHERIEEKSLRKSYRSAKRVLRFVDTLFGKFGFSEYQDVEHICTREEDGHVGIVAYSGDKETSKPECGAFAIVQKMVSLFRNEKIWDSGLKDWRSIKPNDVIILVKNRDDELFKNLSSMLLLFDIKITFNSKKLYHESLIILDFVALARFCRLPLDEYSLLCVLKSPMFSMSEVEILQLVEKAKEISAVNPEQKRVQILTLLDSVRSDELQRFFELAGRVSTEEFFQEVYNTFFNSYSYHELLEASALFGMVSDCKRDDGGNLEYFLQYFDSNTDMKFEIEPDLLENSVKFSTIHGAKGLESPVVFVCNTSKPAINRAAKLKVFEFLDDRAFFENKSSMFFNLKSSKIYDTDISALGGASFSRCYERVYDAMGFQVDTLYKEYIRCLYVAITRAKDMLFVFGEDESERKSTTVKVERTWFDLCLENATDYPKEFSTEILKVEEVNGKLKKLSQEWKWENLKRSDVDTGSEFFSVAEEEPSDITKSSSITDETDTFKEIIDSVEISKQYTQYSDDSEGGVKVDIGAEVDREGVSKNSKERGTFIHMMLCIGDGFNCDGNALKLLTEYYDLKKAEAIEIVDSASSVIESYPELFAEGALSEVDVYGFCKKFGDDIDDIDSIDDIKLRIIDKMIIDNEKKVIKIIDFKTTSLSVRNIVINQLKDYAYVMGRIFIDYLIECYVLWVENLVLEIVCSYEPKRI